MNLVEYLNFKTIITYKKLLPIQKGHITKNSKISNHLFINGKLGLPILSIFLNT